MPMPKLFLTTNFWFKMPRKLADKYNLGLSYILKLSLFHQCKSFSGGVTICKCICNCQDKLSQVKLCFGTNILKEAVVAGKLFGTYLYFHSTFESERAGYIFNINDYDMQVCLIMHTKMFGLGQEAHAAARIILIDRKAIGLCLWKKACWLDLKHNPDHMTI